MSNFTPTKIPTEIDWARLAAFIDGEGCIRICAVKPKKIKTHQLWIEVIVANTDPRLPNWIAETFGVGRVTLLTRGYSKPNWAHAYRWNASCQQAAWILSGCFNLFLIKREQAEIALAFQKTVGKRPGVKGHPPELLAKRWELKSALSRLKGSSSRRELKDMLLDKSMSETVN